MKDSLSKIMKAILWTVALLLPALTQVCRAQDDVARTRRLRDLVTPGHKVAVVLEDRTDDIDEKEAYIEQYLRDYSDWVVVKELDKADFILYVTGESQWTSASPTSKTYFMTATIKDPAGEDLWTGETVSDWANLANGLRAVRGVSWKLVKNLLLSLRALLGDAPQLVTV